MEEIIVVTEEKVSAETKKQNPMTVAQAILLNALIIATAIIIGAFVMHGSFDGVGVAAKPDTKQQAVDIRKVNLGNNPFIGSATAKVAIAYWSDFQCPFCKKFETSVLPDIITKYVATGKVAIVFKDYSFLGSDSETAAVYARSVWALYPQQYFTWRTAMFTAQDKENADFGDEASVVKLTSAVAGLDVTKIQADVQKNKAAYVAAIDADKTEAANYNIQGTPSFITGTQLIPGYAEFATFAKALDSQLK
jgi:protein-disulfide isomerase